MVTKQPCMQDASIYFDWQSPAGRKTGFSTQEKEIT